MIENNTFQDRLGDAQSASLSTISCLLASQPTLVRGRTYCDTDFRRRALDWSELLPETKPTRIQPARAAKKRTADAAPVEAYARPAKKAKGLYGKTIIPACGDYTLDEQFVDVSAERFRQVLESLLDSKETELAKQCAWASAPLPGDHVPRQRWCPIVAQPLTCTEMAHCLHGIGRGAPKASLRTIEEPGPSERKQKNVARTSTTLAGQQIVQAPEAHMAPCLLLTLWPEDAVIEDRDEFDDSQHVKERTVELAGLRFAVDMCNGALRVWMR